MLNLPTALRCSIYLLHYDALFTYCITMLLIYLHIALRCSYLSTVLRCYYATYCITMLLCYLLHYDAIMLPTALRCYYVTYCITMLLFTYYIMMLLFTILNYDALIYPASQIAQKERNLSGPFCHFYVNFA